VCSHCKVEKPLAVFGKRRSERDGLFPWCRECRAVSDAAYCAANPEKRKARDAAYRAANPEKRKASDAAWRAANREEVKARKAVYRAAHRERAKATHAAWRAAHPEERKAASAAWRAANRDECAALCALRRARKVTNGPLEKFLWTEIAERDGWRCQLCGIRLSARLRGTYDPRAPVVDHIVPLKVGGPHIRANVQLACWSCNSHKGTRIIGQLRVA